MAAPTLSVDYSFDELETRSDVKTFAYIPAINACMGSRENVYLCDEVVLPRGGSAQVGRIISCSTRAKGVMMLELQLYIEDLKVPTVLQPPTSQEYIHYPKELVLTNGTACCSRKE